MPTADRTTVRAAVDELIVKFRGNLVAEPPTAAKPFRRVEAGLGQAEDYPRPFLALRVTSIVPIGVTDDDKIMEATATMQAVIDATNADAQAGMLDAVGAIDDYLDSIHDTGVIEGSEGFDRREWRLQYSKTTAGSRVVSAEAAFQFVVKVKRGSNRVSS